MNMLHIYTSFCLYVNIYIYISWMDLEHVKDRGAQNIPNIVEKMMKILFNCS